MTRARDVAGYISNVNASGKNFLINGGFDHFQRGTAVQRIIAGQWWADRWTPSLYQVARYQRIALGYINSELNSPYALRCGSSNLTEDANGTRIKAAQTIESVNSLPLAGKKVTVSYWIKFSSATFTSISNLAGGGNSTFGNFYASLQYFTTTTDGSSGSTFPDSSYQSYPATNGTFPTTWTKYSFTTTVPADVKNVGMVFSFDSLGSTTTSDALYYDLAQVQLETGSIATSFSRAGGSIGAELALCQRYYQRKTANTGYARFGSGQTNSTTTGYPIVNLNTPLRVAPSVLEFANLGLWDGINVIAVTALTIADSAPTAITLSATVASGLTVARPTDLLANANSSAYIGFGAEL
jgi:hypothetical protein